MGTIKSYPNQFDALLAAAQIIEDLPPGTQFAVTVTDADTYQEPSVLNIYAHDTKEQMDQLIHFHPRCGKPADEGEFFVSYRVASLLVSFIIEPEEEDNGRNAGR